MSLRVALNTLKRQRAAAEGSYCRQSLRFNGRGSVWMGGRLKVLLSESYGKREFYLEAALIRASKSKRKF